MRKASYVFASIIILSMLALIFIIVSEKKVDVANETIEVLNKMPTEIVSPAAIIMPSTQMVYNYYYEEDGCVESTSETAPHFLIGMNETDLKNTFNDWLVQNFSKDKVVMQKNISGLSNQHYVIGIKDGYIAVFYQENINGTKLKEMTNTPVNSLALEERKRLEDGIKISGDDKLIAILQDYES